MEEEKKFKLSRAEEDDILTTIVAGIKKKKSRNVSRVVNKAAKSATSKTKAPIDVKLKLIKPKVKSNVSRVVNKAAKSATSKTKARVDVKLKLIKPKVKENKPSHFEKAAKTHVTKKPAHQSKATVSSKNTLNINKIISVILDDSRVAPAAGKKLRGRPKKNVKPTSEMTEEEYKQHRIDEIRAQLKTHYRKYGEFPGDALPFEYFSAGEIQKLQKKFNDKLDKKGEKIEKQARLLRSSKAKLGEQKRNDEQKQPESPIDKVVEKIAHKAVGPTGTPLKVSFSNLPGGKNSQFSEDLKNKTKQALGANYKGSVVEVDVKYADLNIIVNAASNADIKNIIQGSAVAHAENIVVFSNKTTKNNANVPDHSRLVETNSELMKKFNVTHVFDTSYLAQGKDKRMALNNSSTNAEFLKHISPSKELIKAIEEEEIEADEDIEEDIEEEEYEIEDEDENGDSGYEFGESRETEYDREEKEPEVDADVSALNSSFDQAALDNILLQ